MGKTLKYLAGEHQKEEGGVVNIHSTKHPKEGVIYYRPEDKTYYVYHEDTQQFGPLVDRYLWQSDIENSISPTVIEMGENDDPYFWPRYYYNAISTQWPLEVGTAVEWREEVGPNIIQSGYLFENVLLDYSDILETILQDQEAAALFIQLNQEVKESQEYIQMLETYYASEPLEADYPSYEQYLEDYAAWEAQEPLESDYDDETDYENALNEWLETEPMEEDYGGYEAAHQEWEESFVNISDYAFFEALNIYLERMIRQKKVIDWISSEEGGNSLSIAAKIYTIDYSINSSTRTCSGTITAVEDVVPDIKYHFPKHNFSIKFTKCYEEEDLIEYFADIVDITPRNIPSTNSYLNLGTYCVHPGFYMEGLFDKISTELLSLIPGTNGLLINRKFTLAEDSYDNVDLVQSELNPEMENHLTIPSQFRFSRNLHYHHDSYYVSGGSSISLFIYQNRLVVWPEI